ncbi:MAG: hypothetical protein JO101_08450 [Candidatus Eremiobacteraeota bacterium]|nr:hypothetical protein [Candidatus Eremiobacteraeota bacterium]MBV8355334.1 hypothetical protein [Candidatus Eremiobacteraeota bacterium]
MKSRVALAGGALAVALLIAVCILCRDSRVALFASPLSGDQLAEVDAQLTAWNVVFTPTADNIRIDHRRRSAILARLALAGVPHAHVVETGEALAHVGALTPQTVLDAQTRAGLEGDLEKALRGLGGIAEARVIVAPARAGLFADEPAGAASASVRVSAQPGTALTAATLAAVRAFVAAGVPGLRPERVTVVDDRGEVGGSPSADDEARGREVALQSALDAAFGADATIVRVRIERDERAREVRDVRHEPSGRMLARTTQSERFAGEKKTYVKTSVSEDGGSDLHEERTVLVPGALARISVAVIVDARRGLDLLKIRALALAAGGLDPARGDTLTVEAVNFDRPHPRGVQPYAYAAAALFDATPALVIGVVVLVALRTGARPLAALVPEIVRRARLRRCEKDFERLTPGGIFEALQNEPPHAVAAVLATLRAPLATAVLELYPAAARSAIATRMTRRLSPLVTQGGLLDG